MTCLEASGTGRCQQQNRACSISAKNKRMAKCTCWKCKVSMCIFPCFLIYHTKINFQNCSMSKHGRGNISRNANTVKPHQFGIRDNSDNCFFFCALQPWWSHYHDSNCKLPHVDAGRYMYASRQTSRLPKMLLRLMSKLTFLHVMTRKFMLRYPILSFKIKLYCLKRHVESIL
jgi:hypothetical protein